MNNGKKIAALLSALGLMFTLNIASAETYTAAAQGMGGDVPVSVTMENGKIAGITVGNNNETQGIGDKAIEVLPDKIVEQQSLVVDVVAGATITSNAILSAAKTALTEAGVDVAPFMVKQEIVLPEGETEETDVVIVGAGLAGLMAAYELKTDYPDISYILVEKLDMITGSIPVTGGAILATTSRLHQADNRECSVQDIIDLFEYTSGTTINETLVSNVYEHSDVVLNRLLDMGTNFPNPSLSSKYSDKVYCYFHENSGAGFADVLNAYFEANPLALRTGTKAENLLVEDGKVVGVHVTDSEKTYDIRSKAVILATGGFGSSPEYMEKYLPLFADGFFSTNAGATGDGITMTAQFGTPVIGDGSMGSIVEEDGSALILSITQASASSVKANRNTSFSVQFLSRITATPG